MTSSAIAAQATAAQIREARGWIADCGWPDMTRTAVRRLTAAQVVAGVQRHYCGGWAQFVSDAS